MVVFGDVGHHRAVAFSFDERFVQVSLSESHVHFCGLPWTVNCDLTLAAWGKLRGFISGLAVMGC
jgi:hypothetical protein